MGRKNRGKDKAKGTGTVKRHDWVKTKLQPNGPVGIVRRMARDGSWADVCWSEGDTEWSKRMLTKDLVPQHTIPQPGGMTVTDVNRERELEAERQACGAERVACGTAKPAVGVTVSGGLLKALKRLCGPKGRFRLDCVQLAGESLTAADGAAAARVEIPGLDLGAPILAELETCRMRPNDRVELHCNRGELKVSSRWHHGQMTFSEMVPEIGDYPTKAIPELLAAPPEAAEIRVDAKLLRRVCDLMMATSNLSVTYVYLRIPTDAQKPLHVSLDNDHPDVTDLKPDEELPRYPQATAAIAPLLYDEEYAK